MLPVSTYYRHLSKHLRQRRQEQLDSLETANVLRLHWIDNFARWSRLNPLRINKSIFCSMKWTAHGTKTSPSAFNTSWIVKDGLPVPAFPELDVLFDQERVAQLRAAILDGFCLDYRSNSYIVQANITRLPPKAMHGTLTELQHLQRSADGLRYFDPVAIYQDDIQSTQGLLSVLNRVAQLEGIGDIDSAHLGHYSHILCDVTIFWSIFRFMHAYRGLSFLRLNLFLVFGPWHSYMYGFQILWDTFRDTFLASAFQCLFPNDNLFFRPKLQQSATFFMWLHLSYPRFSAELDTALNFCALQLMATDLQYCEEVMPTDEEVRRWRSRYVHLLNLRALFQYCIPVVFDYGATLKQPDGKVFLKAQYNLFAMNLMCKTNGSRSYRYGMLVYQLMFLYWQAHEMPFCDAFFNSPTFFSEESGEIALSCLAQNQPTAGHVDIESTCRAWQLVKMKLKTSRPNNETKRPLSSKYRFIDPDETAVESLAAHFR